MYYWPVLLTQASLPSTMYTLNQRKRPLVEVVDLSEMLQGIKQADVLQMTFKGDLVAHFGAEGTTYKEGDYAYETRELMQTTAGKYILKDECGDWAVNPMVAIDSEHWHGLYSYNNDVFPFVVKPYKYMLLRNGRNSKATVMLLELADPKYWQFESRQMIDDEGYLLDRAKERKLINTRDTLLSKNLEKTEFADKSYAQWIILYAVSKVLKVRNGKIDDNEWGVVEN